LRLRGHLGLWLATLAGLLVGGDLPGWLLWSPSALGVAVVVGCAVSLPRLAAPGVAFAGVAALAAAHAPWIWTSFALSLAVGSVTLGVAARARVRPGAAVLLASVPVAVWVVGCFMGPDRVALENALRAESVRAEALWVALAAQQSVSAEAIRGPLRQATETMVLLLPAIGLAQVVPLMAWGYSLAGAALDGSRHAMEPLPRFSRLRFPDGAVWLLSLGILLLVTRQAAVYRAGANLVAVMAAAYLCQGLSALTFMILTLRTWWLIAGAMVTVLLLLVATPFSVFTCILGLSDVWLDFRRLRSGAGTPDSE
jgi:hypothetical protein